MNPTARTTRPARSRHPLRGANAGRVARAASLLCVVLVAALLGSCGSDDSASRDKDPATSTTSTDDLEKFTVVLDWTPNTNHSGMFLADARGWYAEAGLDVEFVEPGDSSSIQLLAGGKADVAVSVSEEVVPARSEGLPVRSVAAVIEHNTSSLVSLTSAGIERPRDLEGRTYGGWGGQLEEALLHELVACDGGDPSKVNFVEVGEADYRIGMERGQYDTVWIYDGWDGIRLTEIDGADLNRIAFIDHTDCIPDWYTPVLASSDDVMEKRPDDLRAFLAATRRGYQAAIAEPQAAADAVMDVAPDLDSDLVERSARFLADRYASDPDIWGRQDAKIWERFTAFLVKAGMVEAGFDSTQAWTGDFLDPR